MSASVSELPGEERLPCIEVIEGRSKGRVFVLVARSTVIGRMPGAPIHIDDPGVSRRHVRLVKHDDGSVEAMDMRSTNGVLINGEKVERSLLDEGDEISLGPDATMRLCYRAPGDTQSTQAQPPDHEPAPPSSPPPLTVEQGPPAPSPEPKPPRDESTALVSRAELLAKAKARSKPSDPLSPRQLEVSQLVANGMTNAAIAEVLGISPRTVTSHLDHIYGRLNIGSRAALTRWIVERGLTQPPTQS